MLLCAAVGTASHQHGLEACTVCVIYCGINKNKYTLVICMPTRMSCTKQKDRYFCTQHPSVPLYKRKRPLKQLITIHMRRKTKDDLVLATLDAAATQRFLSGDAAK